MLKNILKLEGVQTLNRTAQKALNGGGSNSRSSSCNTVGDCEETGIYCPNNVVCVFNTCLGKIAGSSGC